MSDDAEWRDTVEQISAGLRDALLSYETIHGPWGPEGLSAAVAKMVNEHLLRRWGSDVHLPFLAVPPFLYPPQTVSAAKE